MTSSTIEGLAIKIKQFKDLKRTDKLKKTIAEEIAQFTCDLYEKIKKNESLQIQLAEIAEKLYRALPESAEILIMQQSAVDYFNSINNDSHSNKNYAFSKKKDGDQRGTRLQVTQIKKGNSEQQSSTDLYHIKTHSAGSSNRSNSIKSVDLKELFIYKILAKLGKGPETHFFFNHIFKRGLCIATLDLGHSKPSTTNNTFISFEHWIQKREANKSKYKNIDNDQDSSMRKQIIALDIISRIFSLTDTTTNPSNFGCVESSDVKSSAAWKLLDFRLAVDDSDLYYNPEIFQAFQSGSGYESYKEKGILGSIFNKDNLEKMSLGHKIIKQLSSTLPNWLEETYQEIISYAKNNAAALRVSSADFEDLQDYVTATKNNIQSLLTSFNKKAKTRKLKTHKTSTNLYTLHGKQSSKNPSTKRLHENTAEENTAASNIKKSRLT